MKAFIAVALLVAAVGAQDTLKLHNNKHLLKEHLLQQQQRPITTGLTGHEEGKLFRELPYQTVRRDLGVERRLNNERVTVLSFEELYSTELFREYLSIPLFRQFLEYPVFQQYVTSHLFQQFWVNRQFQQYFRNPVLFYKYIYPQLQTIGQVYTPEINTRTTPVDRSVFDRYRPINTEGFNGQFIRPAVRENVDLDVLRRVQEGYLPYTTGYPTTQYYGQQDRYNVDNVEYKVLLDKIYRTLFLNKEGQVTGEVKTEAKVLPGTHVEEQTVAKIVDPTTGEEKITTGDIKTVEEKVVKVPVPAVELEAPKKEFVDPIVEGQLTKDALLKKLYLTKTLGKKVITAEDLKNIRLPLTLEEEYRIRRNPTDLFKTIDEQDIYNPVVAALYARYGKNIFNKNAFLNKDLEGERPITPEFYNRELYTFVPKENKEFLNLGEDKLHLYNTMLHKDLLQKEIPQTFEGQNFHRVPLTYQTSMINSGLTTFNPAAFKEIKA